MGRASRRKRERRIAKRREREAGLDFYTAIAGQQIRDVQRAAAYEAMTKQEVESWRNKQPPQQQP